MVCSPYFVIGVFALLTVVSMKYYSLSGQNSELAERLEKLQLKLKATTYDLQNVQSSLGKKNDEASKCRQDLDVASDLVDKKTGEFEAADADARACQADLTASKNDLDMCLEEKSALEDAEDEGKADHDAKLEALNKELEDARAEINSLKEAEAQREKLKIENRGRIK